MASAMTADLKTILAFIACVGPKRWSDRMAEIGREAARSQRVGRALAQQHAVEVTIERLRRGGCAGVRTPAEMCVLDLVREAVVTDAELSQTGRARFRAALAAAMVNETTLVPLFHILRTAALQRSRGFAVHFAGF